MRCTRVNLREVYLRTLREEVGPDEEARTCIEDEIDEDLIRNLLVESLTSSQEEMENSAVAGQYFAAMMTCAGGDLASSGG